MKVVIRITNTKTGEISMAETLKSHDYAAVFESKEEAKPLFDEMCSEDKDHELEAEYLDAEQYYAENPFHQCVALTSDKHALCGRNFMEKLMGLDYQTAFFDTTAEALEAASGAGDPDGSYASPKILDGMAWLLGREEPFVDHPEELGEEDLRA